MRRAVPHASCTAASKKTSKSWVLSVVTAESVVTGCGSLLGLKLRSFVNPATFGTSKNTSVAAIQKAHGAFGRGAENLAQVPRARQALGAVEELEEVR